MYPNTTLEAEWDCLAQILETTKELGSVAPSLAHIKGHQDKNTQYEELPLLAPLNCDADCYANTFLCNHPNIDHKPVHQFPAGECILHLHTGTITRDIKHETCQTRTLPAFKAYMIWRNYWHEETTFDMVDWTAHGHTLTRHEKHRATLVKFLHHILPLGNQVNKYDPKYSASCPLCNHEKETMEHFWKCPARSRLAWRQQFLKDLSQKLINLGTGQDTRDLLVTKLRAVLDGENPDNVPENPTIADICQQQRTLGWDQLLRGRFPKAWSMSTQTQPGKTHSSYKGWTTKVINFIFTQWWSLWELRNQDRHDRDLATTQEAAARQVDRELILLYNTFEDNAPQHLQWIFDTTIDTRQQWPTNAI